MIIIKSRSSMQTVLAAFACVVFLVTAVQAGEMDMMNLVVKLGFDRIPDEYTCQGMDVSPRIEIQGLNATSLAVIVDDPDAAPAVFTHWLIWNIPPTDVIPKAIAKSATLKEPFRALAGYERLRRDRICRPLSASRKAAPIFLPRIWSGQDAEPAGRCLCCRSGEGNARPCAAERRSSGNLWEVIFSRLFSVSFLCQFYGESAQKMVTAKKVGWSHQTGPRAARPHSPELKADLWGPLPSPARLSTRTRHH